MMQFRRGWKRLFGGHALKPDQSGLTGGDSALLELLDIALLRDEARSADIAAARIDAHASSQQERGQQRLAAAIAWREVARRSGDATALRKAAAMAETAAADFEDRKNETWARARCEQAFCAMLGAELFGDPGLNAAAEIALNEARAVARGGLAAPLADLGLATIEARRDLQKADMAGARAAAARFDAPILALDTLARRSTPARPLAALARLERADLLCGFGAKLQDADLLHAALRDAAAAARGVDSAYEPLTWARAEIMRGQALTLLGEVTAEVDDLATGATALATALDHLTREHSPLDWAKTQIALAQALQGLGEVSADERAYEKAVTCYDRANLVLRDAEAPQLRGLANGERAMCLARSAELTGDLAVLDTAEAALKIELTKLHAGRDPLGWALAQVHLARLYEARLDITGRDKGQRAAAVLALEAAVEVFAELGSRSLGIVAGEALQRLSVRATT